MKTWKLNLIVLTLLAIASSSCYATQTETPAPAPSVTNVPSAILQPTILPSATAPKKTVAHVDFSCWPIKPLQEGNNFKGSFVYVHYDPAPQGEARQVNSLFAWDLNSFSSEQVYLNGDVEKLIRTEGIDDHGFNNSNQLVLLTKNNLVLVSPQNAEIYPFSEKANTSAKHPYNNLWLEIYPRSDGRLLFTEIMKDGYKEGDIGLTDTYYIFDPATKAFTTHKVSLPDFDASYGRGWGVSFSPDMKYVLYRSTPVDTKDSFEYRFTLLDIEKNKVLWVIPPEKSNLRLLYEAPHWLPNTNVITAQFIDQNTGHANYYLVSLDGTISPLNDLEKDPGGLPVLGGHDWSPNGKYLLSSYPNPMIWDNQTQTWYKPCLPDEDKFESPSAYQPLWPSFDSSYFMVTTRFVVGAQNPGTSSFTYIFRGYILDIANKVIYTLPENVTQSQFPSLYKDGSNDFLGWVNWELP